VGSHYFYFLELYFVDLDNFLIQENLNNSRYTFLNLKKNIRIAYHEHFKSNIESFIYNKTNLAKYLIHKNKIYTNYRNYFPKPIYSYIEGNTIVGVFGVGSKKFFYKGNINEFKGNIKQTSSFIIQIVETENGLYYFSLLLIIILILIYFYRKPIEKLIFPYNGIVFKNQKQIFKYKNKIIHFEDQEKIILFFLIDNLNQYISLNELNQLFEKANQPETISATVKRREQAVSGLLSKVSKITGIDESKLILERKNSEDKRIKDILLLPNLLKLVP
jgi:hypothetical protein